jgi:hypothetical protein
MIKLKGKIKKDTKQIITIKRIRIKFETQTKWHDTFNFYGKSAQITRKRESIRKKWKIDCHAPLTHTCDAPLNNPRRTIFTPPSKLVFGRRSKSRMPLEYDDLPLQVSMCNARTNKVVLSMYHSPSYLFYVQFWSI